MLAEVLYYLDPQPGELFVDATVGGGGHSSAIMPRLLPGGMLIGLDCDREAIDAARKRLSAFENSVVLINSNFRYLKDVLAGLDIESVDGLLFDLGVSSYQLDAPERGFSYQVDAPLDMRLGQDRQLTAADIVNNLPEKELAEIIWKYGEERWAARIASFIVSERKKDPIVTTAQLVNIIKKAIPAGARRSGHHPAKRTFQALRIAINDELGSLQAAMDQIEEVLKPGGRVGVISFHSLEDQIVKESFRRLSGQCACPPGVPVCTCNSRKVLQIVTRKPVVPSTAEIEDNPRARSAKLRVAVRVLKGKGGE